MRRYVFLAALMLSSGAAFAGAKPDSSNPPPIAPANGMILYRGADFTIDYPPHWTVDAHFVHDFSPPIPGVSFTVPQSIVSGTNLGSDTRLSVEHVSGACSASRFLDAPENEHFVTDGGRGYSMATEDGAGAGNRYEETVYALTNGKTCYGIHYFIHYSAIQNYDPGTVKQFDRDGLIAVFDTMRRSLAFTMN